ncbi:MAG TPA: deoxyribonuclease IV [Anaerovoracaceae bacterium]|nr:deoxyribonuclease IV [Anaerovoracaceae bacterium]
MYLGCHISSAKGYEGMGKEALGIGANTFAFFTRNPRGGKSKAIDINDVNSLKSILKENFFGPLVAHAPYTINPCSKDQRVREFAKIAFKEDLERMELMPGNYYNFHPGSHIGQGSDVGIEIIINFLNKCLDEKQRTTVLLETMAGKGTEVGKNFQEISKILNGIVLKNKVGVCLDTCHVYDGGYDIVNRQDDVFEEFDKFIGINRLKAIHINDSKNILGSKKDRHAKIGEGHIGKDAILSILNKKEFKDIPFILETPQEDINGYGEEIKMLRKELSVRGYTS